ncbi:MULTISPECIES: LytTR family DNA-binding domain-containing protein [Microbacterium]|uniref:LytR/AlgR family response regulator transcription factor n=1 Tax=Microbacterium TaxID=33882 RepID=UPI001E6275EE|nr:LytTR family DNA-binding domain-containing protein [Microbacterium nymphoidis]MCD2499565.1 LytTR family DNA-binding domain-containing protein [Microbacterium nymphoidis]
MTCDILIADDEQPVLDELAALLRADERIGDIRLARSGADALRLLSEAPVSVVFLDIHMPGLSGLDLARALQQFQQRPAVVFITADEARAVEAFDVAAVDYLLKPVRPERLRVAVGRAIETHGPGEPALADERIPVTIAGETRLVRRSEVRWVQAQGDYSRLWTAAGDHLVRVPISELEERWSGAGFLRVHRSYLVHVDAIVAARLSGQAPTVSLPEIELPVSRRLVSDVRDRLMHP